MTSINTAKVPVALKSQIRWVAWKYGTKDGRATKIPYSATNGGTLRRASTIDPTTWCGFFQAKRFAEEHNLDGIGFVLGDGISGVDFDGCRNPESGEIDSWALDEINKISSYSEVSPTGTGIKTFLRGELPGSGAKRTIADLPGHGGKQAAIEMYSAGRYFCVTGLRLSELPATIEARDLTDLYNRVRKASAPAMPTTSATTSSTAKIPSKIPNGRRHEFLLAHAGRLLQRGIGQEALAVELLRVNREVFQQPKDETTIRKQAQDFYRRWQASPSLILNGTRNQPIRQDKNFLIPLSGYRKLRRSTSDICGCHIFLRAC